VGYVETMGQTHQRPAEAADPEAIAAALRTVLPSDVLPWALALPEASTSHILLSRVHAALSRALRSHRHTVPVQEASPVPASEIDALSTFGHSTDQIASLLGIRRPEILIARAKSGDLSAHIRARTTWTGHSSPCPDTQNLWLASTPSDTPVLPSILKHVATCPACAESWHLAVALRHESATEADVIPLFGAEDTPIREPAAPAAHPKVTWPVLQVSELPLRRWALRAFGIAAVVIAAIAMAILSTY